MAKGKTYNEILEYWGKRNPFIDEEDIPDVPIVLPRDYNEVITPNIIRCGGIPKAKLIIGETYIGNCRNTTEAIWDGEHFNYIRTKFGLKYNEKINHFEDDNGYDVFVPIKLKCQS